MRSLLVALASCALLAACGSGDGGTEGPGPAASEFAGTYVGALVAGVAGDVLSARAEWGSLESVGTMVTGLATRNEWTLASPSMASEITTGIAQGPFPMFTGPSRRLIIEGDLCLDGAIGDDGRFVVLNSAAAGDDPALAVALRPGSGQNVADVVGGYHFIAFIHEQDPQARRALAGSVVFDGAGGALMNFETNTDGTFSGPLAPSATYTVTGDGRMSFTQAGVAQFEGVLAPGADVAVLGGDRTAASGARGIMIFIRGSAAATASLFSGTYRRAGFSPLAAVGWDSWAEIDVSNGTGFVDRTQRSRNGDGVIYPFLDLLGVPYTVMADGGFNAAFPGGVGAISPDGRFAAVAVLAPGTDPRVDLLVRLAP